MDKPPGWSVSVLATGLRKSGDWIVTVSTWTAWHGQEVVARWLLGSAPMTKEIADEIATTVDLMLSHSLTSYHGVQEEMPLD